MTDDFNTLVAPLGFEPKEAPPTAPAPRSGTHRCAPPAAASEECTHLWVEAQQPPQELVTQAMGFRGRQEGDDCTTRPPVSPGDIDDERTQRIPASGSPTALTRAAFPSLPWLAEAPRAAGPLPIEELEPSTAREWWELGWEAQPDVSTSPHREGGAGEPTTSPRDRWMLFATAGFSAAGVVFLALAALLHHWGQ